jgi:hypothetical protein
MSSARRSRSLSRSPSRSARIRETLTRRHCAEVAHRQIHREVANLESHPPNADHEYCAVTRVFALPLTLYALLFPTLGSIRALVSSVLAELCSSSSSVLAIGQSECSGGYRDRYVSSGDLGDHRGTTLYPSELISADLRRRNPLFQAGSSSQRRRFREALALVASARRSVSVWHAETDVCDG